MKNSKQPTNSQRKLPTRDAIIAFLCLLAFALLLGLSSSVSSYDFDKQSELSARCRSMGGELADSKCFRSGEKI